LTDGGLVFRSSVCGRFDHGQCGARPFTTSEYSHQHPRWELSDEGETWGGGKPRTSQLDYSTRRPKL